jgi:hypothetical protein
MSSRGSIASAVPPPKTEEHAERPCRTRPSPPGGHAGVPGADRIVRLMSRLSAGSRRCVGQVPRGTGRDGQDAGATADACVRPRHTSTLERHPVELGEQRARVGGDGKCGPGQQRTDVDAQGHRRDHAQSDSQGRPPVPGALAGGGRPRDCRVTALAVGFPDPHPPVAARTYDGRRGGHTNRHDGLPICGGPTIRLPAGDVPLPVERDVPSDDRIAHDGRRHCG